MCAPTWALNSPRSFRSQWVVGFIHWDDAFLSRCAIWDLTKQPTYFLGQGQTQHTNLQKTDQMALQWLIDIVFGHCFLFENQQLSLIKLFRSTIIDSDSCMPFAEKHKQPLQSKGGNLKSFLGAYISVSCFLLVPFCSWQQASTFTFDIVCQMCFMGGVRCSAHRNSPEF